MIEFIIYLFTICLFKNDELISFLFNPFYLVIYFYCVHLLKLDRLQALIF